MKKNCLFFSLILVLILQVFSLNFNILEVKAEPLKYARINQSGCYLYKTATENPSISNIWCELENSYFVEIIADYNDSFYKVNYNTIIGFAKKSDLIGILNTPLSPYPSGINISLNNTSGCYLRSAPITKTSTNNIVKTLDKGTSNILFIGYIHGDESIDLRGNLWYLVKYGTDIGYIYSDYTANKVTVYPNLEDVSLVSNNIESTMLNPLKNSTTIIVVVVIMLPCLVILILLFSPKVKTKKIRKKGKPLKEIDATELTDIYNDIDL